MKLKASPNARASLDRVIARFQEGDISPIVAVAQIKLPADAPAAK